MSALAALFLLSCAQPPPPSSPSAACSDLSGIWILTEEIDKSGCGEPPETITFSARWTQSGCAGTLTVPLTAIALAGTVDGDTLTASGSYRDMGRIEKHVTLTRSGDTLTGAATWSWALAGALSCEGTSAFTGQLNR